MTRSRAVAFAVVAAALACGGKSKGRAADAPDTVRTAAEKLMGPNVALHREGAIYEATGTTDLEMELGADGSVRETEVALPLSVLPSAVRAAVQGKLPPGAVVRESELVVTADAVRFEVDARLSSGKDLEFLVDPNGQVLGEEREDDGGDGDEEDANDRTR